LPSCVGNTSQRPRITGIRTKPGGDG
jgi:hypothetical protein